MSKVSPRILKRVYLVFAVFLVFGIAITMQVVRIQAFQRDQWMEQQEKGRVYYKNILATRGSILADDGSILATTLPFFRVAVDVTVWDEKSYGNFEDSLALLCNRLSEHFGDDSQNAAYFYDLLTTARNAKDRHVYLFSHKRTLTLQEMKLLQSFPILNKGQFGGGMIIEKINNKRFYPFNNLSRITLGLLRDDTVGFKGIEYSFNKFLRGQDGKQMVQVIAGGVEVPLSDYEAIEARDGYDVLTTLNVNYQDIVYATLAKAVQKHDAISGVAILMEVKTGHIKAIANYPETYNQAIAEQVEPGSTFKIATSMVALDAGIISPSDTIHTGNGVMKFYDRTMRDEKGYGVLTFKEAFEKSSNVAISRIIVDHYKANPQAFFSALGRTGILTPLNFQVKGEPDPYVILPGKPEYNGATLPWTSIGYNVKLTPLQITTFVNGIANGGRMMQPLIVSQVRDAAEVKQQYQPTVLVEQMCSGKTLFYIRQMMEGVVQNGTAKNLSDAHYPIAGKTGTAKKLVDGKYQELYRSSFVGYFPADNPQYTLFVMIDEPKEGEIYGAYVAGPVFKEIANNLFTADLIKKSAGTAPVVSDNPGLPTSRLVYAEDAALVYDALKLPFQYNGQTGVQLCKQVGEKVVMKPYSYTPYHMPNLKGMSAKNAMAFLENIGLTVKLKGHGKVVHQSVEPGEQLDKYEEIVLTLSQ